MIKRTLTMAMLGLLVASCQFSEVCDYVGSVEMTMDWESMWGDLQKPDSLTALFYRNGSAPLRKGLKGDTIYDNIPAGDTELITYNQPKGILLKGLETSSGVEIHLPTYFERNTRAVGECPMLCAVNNHLNVPIESVVKQEIAPLPIVKQLVFVVNVIKEGVTGELSACRASITGIATGYSLGKKEPIRSKATVFFSLGKDKKKDSFSHRFFVLGVNPDVQGQESIPKKLSVSVTLDDGEAKAAELDITGLLNDFTANVFKCEVDVKITSLQTDIEIASWQQGAWNQIIIQ